MQTGVVEATNHEFAVNILQRHGLVVIALEAQESFSFFTKEITFWGGVKPKDLVMFSRQLSTLFEAQVPIVESFKALIKQTDKPVFKAVLVKILDDVEGGTPLSKALAKYPKIFSEFYIGMVKSGEVSGKLQNIFSYLADHTEREYYLNSKIKGAMMYPLFIIIAFVIVGLLMMVYVVPQLTAVLEEAGQDLPLTTRILIGASTIIREWFIIIIIAPIIIIAGLWRYVKTPEGALVKDDMILRVPIIGVLFQKVFLSRFSENLSTLIKGGLPIIQALQVTGDVVGNKVYKNIVIKSIKAVRGGGNISGTLEEYPREFPNFVTQMVSTGERTGKLSQILENVARFYQKDVDNMANNLTQLIEPVLIVILGIGVGVLVASILMPIYNIAGGF